MFYCGLVADLQEGEGDSDTVKVGGHSQRLIFSSM